MRSNPNPTYSIRTDHYADDPSKWYVFTYTAAGIAHHFFSELAEHQAKFLAADLAKLQPLTIAQLVGDND